MVEVLGEHFLGPVEVMDERLERVQLPQHVLRRGAATPGQQQRYRMAGGAGIINRVSMGGDRRGTRHRALPMNVAGIGHFVGGNSRDAERSACDATMLNYVSSLIAAMGRC